MIDKRVFAKFSDRIMMYPILMEEIDELNNKVGSVKVSYALCRHCLLYTSDAADD